MVRPKTKELTARELGIMQVFWKYEEATAEEARQHLKKSGEELAYVTVANVVRSLADKGFLKQLNSERPFRYKAVRSFDEVSKNIVGDLMTRLFAGSREAMLVNLLDRRKLTAKERAFLEEILRKQEG